MLFVRLFSFLSRFFSNRRLTFVQSRRGACGQRRHTTTAAKSEGPDCDERIDLARPRVGQYYCSRDSVRFLEGGA